MVRSTSMQLPIVPSNNVMNLLIRGHLEVGMLTEKYVVTHLTSTEEL